MAEETLLRSWRHTPARAAIETFVQSVTADGEPSLVPVPERVSVFANDQPGHA